jgi:mono/diheme cytochrome c family protein
MDMRGVIVPVVALLLLQPSPATAQDVDAGDSKGAAIYAAACAACHGPDGRGMAQELVGFDTPLPDFTDCSFASPETTADWTTIVHDGGPARAFNRRMPAFGEALSSEEIDLVVAHVRTLCASRAWPRGELNLPRPLVTEKAFPENEIVVDLSTSSGDTRSISQRFVYEHRIGARTQYEIAVPLEMQSSGSHWDHGLGDVAVALKSTLFHSIDTGSIFTVGGEMVLPTGKEAQGLGEGVTRVEPFVAVGQILPHEGFFHFQGGIEAAVTTGTPTEAFWRSAVGITLLQGRYGRSWSPMIELLGERELERGERALWDAVPQLQVSLSRRQHILINVGVRIPVNERPGRSAELLSYFLWDWFDGGLFDGWR